MRLQEFSFQLARFGTPPSLNKQRTCYTCSFERPDIYERTRFIWSSRMLMLWARMRWKRSSYGSASRELKRDELESCHFTARIHHRTLIHFIYRLIHTPERERRAAVERKIVFSVEFMIRTNHPMLNFGNKLFISVGIRWMFGRYCGPVSICLFLWENRKLEVFGALFELRSLAEKRNWMNQVSVSEFRVQIPDTRNWKFIAILCY